MTCMCCGHAQTDHNVHGCMLDGCHCPSFERAGDASPGPTRPGYQHSPATYVEGREAPRREAACGADGEHGDYCDLPASHPGVPHMMNPAARAYLDLAAATTPDLEACARAAYEARYADSLHLRKPFADTDESTRALWAEVARAVLAAAGRGGK